jgi:hypothetical protein
MIVPATASPARGLFVSRSAMGQHCYGYSFPHNGLLLRWGSLDES